MAIDRLDPEHRPLAEARDPQRRLIGNCRQFGGVLRTMFGELDEDTTAPVDEVAAAVLDGTPEDWRRLSERSALRVPPVVRSERFQKDVVVPV